MADREARYDSIQSELKRLGCRAVRVTFVNAEAGVIFVLGDEALTCTFTVAHSRLLRLASFCGDEATWDALQEVGRKGLT